MVSFGSILGGVGALASAFGGKDKQTTSSRVDGFQALPKEVQDMLLESYLPKVQNILNMPYQAIPMQRAMNPAGDPFASKGMWDLQNFSDAAGGYFTPFSAGPTGGVNAASYAGAAGSQPQPAQNATGGAPTGNAVAAQYLAEIQKSPQTGGLAKQLQVMLANGSLTMEDLGRGLSSRGYMSKTFNAADPSLWQGGF